MEKNYRVMFTGLGQVELQECEVPAVGDDEVLVKLDVTQISTGTELTYLQGNVDEGSTWTKDIVFPRQPGYSGGGVIVAAGKNMDPALVGKRVNGAFKHEKYQTVDLVKQPERFSIIPDDSDVQGSVFATIATITMGSIRVAKLRPGDTCVVYGAGLVGQMVARNALLAGAGRIFVADVSDLRLSKLPKDPTFIPLNSKKVSVPDEVYARTDGRGADVVFEVTSNPKLVMEELHCLVSRGDGRLVITSSPKGWSTVDFEFCSRRGLTIIGAHNHAVHTPTALPKDPWTRYNDSRLFLDMLRKGRITVNEMITHTFHYKDAVSAYEMLMTDRTQALAVLIDWRD